MVAERYQIIAPQHFLIVIQAQTQAVVFLGIINVYQKQIIHAQVIKTVLETCAY